MIAGCQQGAIGAGQVFVLGLQAGGLNVPLILVSTVQLGRMCGSAAIATVEADAVYRGVVDHRVVDVGIVDIDDVHIGDRAVVKILVITPISSDESDAGIAKAVIDAAIEAD